MLVVLHPEVLRRLSDIEAAEGIPAVDIVHQAVDVWSRLDADGRRIIGIAAMQLVVGQIRGGRA